MSEVHLHVDTSDRVLTLTIDRPEAKNALTLAMRQQIEQLARGRR